MVSLKRNCALTPVIKRSHNRFGNEHRDAIQGGPSFGWSIPQDIFHQLNRNSRKLGKNESNIGKKFGYLIIIRLTRKLLNASPCNPMIELMETRENKYIPRAIKTIII